jgi:hypothetical protein
MTYHADNTLISNRELLGELIAVPFRTVFNFLVAMAEADPKMTALRELSQKSDAELEAIGRSRQGELARILGSHAF